MKIKKKFNTKVENVDIPSKPQPVAPAQPQAPPQQSRREVFNNFNNDEKTKKFGAVLIGKKTYYLLLTSLIIVILLFGVHVFWSNYNVSAGKMAGNSSVEVNVPERSVTVDGAEVNNNYTIEVNPNINLTLNVDVGDEIADQIASEVLDIIEEVTNSSS